MPFQGGEHRLPSGLRALADLSRAFGEAAADWQKLLDTIAERTATLLNGSVSIRLLSQDRRSLERAATFDPEPAVLEAMKEIARNVSLSVDDTHMLSRAFKTASPILIEKLDTETLRRVTQPSVWPALERLELKSALWVPLGVRDRMLGVMTVVRRGEGVPLLTQTDLELSQIVAEQAALTLENARLLEEARLQSAERVLAARARYYAEQAGAYTQSIVDTVRHPLLVLDPSFRILSANPAYFATFGGASEETLDRNLFQLSDGVWNVHGLPALLQEVTESANEVVDFQLEQTFPGVGPRILLLSARKMTRPASDNKATTDAVLLAIEDVTRRREAEHALEDRNRLLEEANEELDAFSYSVSHDLRAPLRIIDGFAKILLEDHQGALDAEGQRVVGIVSSNAQKMNRLIEDLLAFSRLGREPLDKTRVNVKALVKSAIEEASSLEPGRDLEFRTGPLPDALADAGLLKQVFSNLLHNAVKYTRPRTPAVIEISGAEAGETVEYRVTDNGVGFDPRFAAKLFRVFQRLHSLADFEGTGVGLALVDRIVRRHGGRVWAEGELDQGASFSFSLPVRSEKSRPSQIERLIRP